jgi:hypothetical protein
MAHNLDTVGTPGLLKECRDALLHTAGVRLTEEERRLGQLASRMVYSVNHFASLAISMDWHNLSLITQHATHEYYNNMRGYIVQHWPNAARTPGMAQEQDGVIDRQYKDTGLRAVWARCPRAYHAGFISSYHPASMEGQGRHPENKLHGHGLRERHADLVQQIEAEENQRGSAFVDEQSVTVPTSGYWAAAEAGLFYCVKFDGNACGACGGCCPCSSGILEGDGGPVMPPELRAVPSPLPPNPCPYQSRPNCFIGLCNTGPNGTEARCSSHSQLEVAKSMCSRNAYCKGVTEGVSEGGNRVFSLRSGELSVSNTGETCYFKTKTSGGCSF